MSVQAMAYVWALDLPPNQQHVLLALADHADEFGHRVYPSISLTTWKTGYKRRQVQRIMRELRDLGLIVKKPALSSLGTSDYYIDFDAGKRKPAPERGGVIMTPGVTRDTGGVSPMTPKPSVNHQKELLTSESNLLNSIPKGWKPAEWEVFTYWRDRRDEVIGKNGGPPMKPTAGRRGRIRGRIAEGYTMDQLREAVDGVLGSDYHVPRGYTDIELICRDQGHVEQYRALLRDQKRERGADEDDAVAWGKAERERILGER